MHGPAVGWCVAIVAGKSYARGRARVGWMLRWALDQDSPNERTCVQGRVRRYSNVIKRAIIGGQDSLGECDVHEDVYKYTIMWYIQNLKTNDGKQQYGFYQLQANAITLWSVNQVEVWHNRCHWMHWRVGRRQKPPNAGEQTVQTMFGVCDMLANGHCLLVSLETNDLPICMPQIVVRPLGHRRRYWLTKSPIFCPCR
jgi:hypothetical protein